MGVDNASCVTFRRRRQSQGQSQMNPIRMNNMVRLALSLPLLLFNPSSVHSECCNKKEVAGTNSKSGVYWLENSSESSCSDGCVYSKENESNQLYCSSGNFLESAQYLSQFFIST